MKMYKCCIVFSVPILFLIQIATAQQPVPSGSSVVTSPRPLADAARRLQETYGKAVTYEEPILTWRGELQAKPGHDPEGKWELFPTPQSFLMPESGTDTDLATALDNTITAYHEQTSGTLSSVDNDSTVGGFSLLIRDCSRPTEPYQDGRGGTIYSTCPCTQLSGPEKSLLYRLWAQEGPVRQLYVAVTENFDCIFHAIVSN